MDAIDREVLQPCKAVTGFTNICGAESNNRDYRGFELRGEAVLVSTRCPIWSNLHCQDAETRKQRIDGAW
ncbi:hypothetical protein [Afipia sp. DC4300-2b1]|uniref:hypothetical protein n=1 Tax=Afipia sp. DC4300-2b1 TaxID=2804672 RepID=UPI003CED23D8